MCSRLLDGVDPEAVERIRDSAARAQGVEGVSGVRARWLGHRPRAEVNVVVDPDLSVAQGHAVARDVEHWIMHRLPHLGGAVVHVDPRGEAGKAHHHVSAHVHDGLPSHSH